MHIQIKKTSHSAIIERFPAHKSIECFTLTVRFGLKARDEALDWRCSDLTRVIDRLQLIESHDGTLHSMYQCFSYLFQPIAFETPGAPSFG